MALTTTQVSELYVSIFNRASEKSGNEYWAGLDKTAGQIADMMLATSDAQTYFGTSIDANRDFVELIYANTLNKQPADDVDGINYWVAQLDSGVSKGTMVATMNAAVATYSTSTDPVTLAAYNQFTNRVAVSDDAAVNVLTAPTDYSTTMNFGTATVAGGLTVTDAAATVTNATTALVAVATTAATEADAAKTVTYTIAADATSVTEGSTVTFTVTASEAKAVTATTLNYQIAGVEVAGGTATPASDLGKVTGEVTIAAGATTGTITITPTDDGVTEGFEGFKVSLLDSSFATVATSANTVIKDGAEAGTTQSLATTTDNLNGTSGNDTFNSVVILGATTTGTTLSAGDTIAAGDGIDTLNVSLSSADVTPGTTIQAFQATDLEKIVVSNFNTAAFSQTVDTTLVSGLTTVGLSSSGAAGDTLFTGMNSLLAAEMKNGAGDLTLTYNAAATAGTTDVQNLALTNTSAGTFTAAGIETVAITTSLVASTLTAISATSATKLTIAGDKNLTVIGEISTTTVDASANTAGVTLALGNATQTVTGSTSNDDINAGVNLTSADTISAGAGTSDKLSISTATTVVKGTADAKGIMYNVSGFETVEINSTNDNAKLDMTNITGVTTVVASDNVETVTITDGPDTTTETISIVLNGTTYTTAVVAVDTETASAAALATVLNNVSGFNATSAAGVLTVTATTGELVELSGITESGATDAVYTIDTEQNVTFDKLAAGTAVDIYSAADVTAKLADASGTTDVMNVNIKQATADTAIASTVDAVIVEEIETLNLAVTGMKVDTLKTLSALTAGSKLTTLNITGDSDFKITDTASSNTKLATIDASALTGDFTLGDAVAALGQTITTGLGNDSITMATGTLTNADTINMGANTTLTTGLAGTDTLNATITGLTATTGALNISNVENINLTTSGNNTINATSITSGTLSVTDNTQTITNLSSSVTVGLGLDANSSVGTANISLTDETGTSDMVNISVNNKADTATDSTIISENIETMNIALAADANNALLTLTGVDGTPTINVTGGLAGTVLTLNDGTDKLNADVTTFDASAFKGSVLVDASAATAGVNLSANSASTTANTLIGSAQADTFNITGTTGTTGLAQTVTGGAGVDTLNLTASADATFNTNNISAVENINFTLTGSSAVIVDGLTGLNHADVDNITISGGNSLSSFKNITTALGAATTVKVDASGYNGFVDLLLQETAVEAGATVTIIGSAATTDELNLTTTNSATIALNTTAIETINILEATGTGTSVSLENATDVTTVGIDSDQAIALTKVNKSVVVQAGLVTTDANQVAAVDGIEGVTLTVGYDDVTAANDAVTINLADTDAGTATATFDIDGIETITFDVVKTAAATFESHSISLAGTVNATNKTALVLKGGEAGDTFGFASSGIVTDVTSINASALLNNLTIDAADKGSNAMTITAGAGNDSIVMEHKDDVLDGGAGTSDTLTFGYSAVLSGVIIDLSSTTDQVTSFDAASNTAVQVNFENIDLSGHINHGAVVTGSAAANIITGSASTDNINAGAGDDTVKGGAGADTLAGGAGTADTLDLSDLDVSAATDDGIVVNVSGSAVATVANSMEVADGSSTAGVTAIADGKVAFLDAASESATQHIDTISGFEKYILSTEADIFYGSTTSETITGGAGADIMSGGATGVDTFIYNAATEGAAQVTISALDATDDFTATLATADTITDFTTGTDKIQISGALLTAINGTNDAVNGTDSTAVLLADNGNIDLDTGTVFILNVADKLAGDNFGDISAIYDSFATTNSGTPANDTAAQEYILAIGNNSGTEFGIYHYLDVAAAGGDIAVNDKITLLSIVTTATLAADDFTFIA